MWWHFWAIIGSIVIISLGILWAVVSCTQNCFAPEGTRGPKVRTFYNGAVADMSLRSKAEPDNRYIMNNGELSWKDPQAPPREVYKA